MCKRYNVTDFDLLVVVKEQEVLVSTTTSVPVHRCGIF